MLSQTQAGPMPEMLESTGIIMHSQRIGDPSRAKQREEKKANDDPFFPTTTSASRAT